VFHKRWLLIVFLVVSFALALGIRLYDLSDLPLDFHPTRQLQSMLKARGMFAAEANIYNAMDQQIAISQWRSLPTEEPEVVEHLAVWTYRALGRVDLWFPRFYSILFWLIGGVGLYLLLKRLTGTDGAVVGTLFYLFLPYGISASRAFMPDPLMMALLIWSIWALYRWSEQPGWGWAILAGVLSGLTLYVKLTAVFYIACVFLCLAIVQLGFKKMWSKLQFWAIGVLALLPAMLYNLLGIYVFKFIGSDAVDNRILLNMLAAPLTYVQWNAMIGTVVGFGAFLLAIAGSFAIIGRKPRAAALGIWLGYLVFGFFFIYYYTSHDYYHLPLMLPVAVGLAGLAQALLPKLSELLLPAWLTRALIILLLLAGVGESVWQVRNDFKRTDYRPQAAFWQKIGSELQGKTALALTEDYNGRLSYWGWDDAAYLPASNELIHRELAGHDAEVARVFAADSVGKDFFLVTMMDDPTMTGGLMDYLQKTYPVYDQGTGYIIFDLRTKK
jgi:4-amino-4-deoxy-L-arabinose transferase and related glycosyltransferases of PMT family